MGIQIREYEKNDYSKICWGLGNDEWVKKVVEIAKSISDEPKEYELCLVACDDNDIVGFIYGFLIPNGVLLPQLLYVKEEYRKQGIATNLLEVFESRSGGNASIIYYHKKLHNFYEKRGYQCGENLEVGHKEL